MDVAGVNQVLLLLISEIDKRIKVINKLVLYANKVYLFSATKIRPTFKKVHQK